MPCKPTTLWLIAAVALATLGPAAELTTAAAQESLAEGEDGDDDTMQRRGPLPPEEAPEGKQIAPTMLGATRRPDPFDSSDAPPMPSLSRGPTGAPGAVICEAGCDGPRGKVVYGR